MRILCLTTNGPHEASTRYRVLQFEPALRAAGHTLQVHAFFAEQGRHGLGYNVRAFARQLAALLDGADRVLVHRFMFPRAGNLLVRLCRAPIIYDFDDALWLAHPREQRYLLAAATHVLAGNAYLAEHAARHARSVEVMPTVVDTAVFHPRLQRPDLTGWIGSPTTFRYLRPLLSHLPRPLRIVGAGVVLQDAEQPAWSAADEPRLFAELSVGLYPLTDDAWARGKCGLKALQYMACGVPAVMSPVGVVPEIAGDAALYAGTPEAWGHATRTLLADADLRRALAERARSRLTYTLDRYAPRFLQALQG